MVRGVVCVLAAVLLLQVCRADDAGCGPSERLRLVQDWTEAYGNGQHRVDLGVQSFNLFFQRNPDARKLFERVNVANIHSPEFQAHIARIMNGLDIMISLLNERAVLGAVIKHLNAQHQDRNIPDEYYAQFGHAFLDTLPKFMDHRPNIDAWKSCYNLLVQGLTVKPAPAADAPAAEQPVQLPENEAAP